MIFFGLRSRKGIDQADHTVRDRRAVPTSTRSRVFKSDEFFDIVHLACGHAFVSRVNVTVVVSRKDTPGIRRSPPRSRTRHKINSLGQSGSGADPSRVTLGVTAAISGSLCVRRPMQWAYTCGEPLALGRFQSEI